MKYQKLILIALIILTLAFIWGQSLKSVPESSAESKVVLEIVKPVIEKVVGEGNVTENLVRKLAHFIEFCLLGCVLMTLTATGFRVRWQSFVNCMFFGLSAAVTDESIQIFSNRGSQVIDVLLDFSSVCVGLLLVLVIYAVVRRCKK